MDTHNDKQILEFDIFASVYDHIIQFDKFNQSLFI